MKAMPDFDEVAARMIQNVEPVLRKYAAQAEVDRRLSREAINAILDVIQATPKPVKRLLAGLVLAAGAFLTLVGAVISVQGLVAILSIAFNKPYPIVDGNVRRVLSRINGWTDDNSKALWDAAASWPESTSPRNERTSIRS